MAHELITVGEMLDGLLADFTAYCAGRRDAASPESARAEARQTKLLEHTLAGTTEYIKAQRGHWLCRRPEGVADDS